MKRLLLTLSLSTSLQAKVFQTPLETDPKSMGHVIFGPMKYQDLLPVAGNIAADKNQDINIIISSPGGQIRAADLIVNAMESKKAAGHSFTCYVIDLAASAAFDVFLHCDRRIIIGRAVLLWHPALIAVEGRLNALQARDLLVDLQMLYDRLLTDLQKRLPMSPEDVKFHYDRETFWYADQLDAVLLDPNFMEVYPALKFKSP
jgi:ATP-dependent protease ClpP protease subunit